MARTIRRGFARRSEIAPYPAARMATRKPQTKRRIGIDTGGTFTDIAALSGGRLTVHKVPSTPDDPGRAVLNGLADVRAPNEAVDVVHGTTVGLNAVLTGNLAKTAFVTNVAFEDLIEIGRQERSDLYDLRASKPVIPVPRRLRFGIDSRRSQDGTRPSKPTVKALRALRERIGKAKVESIAIGLLHSYAHPEDEHEVRDALAPLGLPITCSADLLATAGEFERYTAAILNAATRPIVSSYLQRMRDPIAPGTLRLMRSSGGIMAHEEAAEFPARAIFSGPAGGIVATSALARRMKFQDVAALDMGGTSTDVCLVQQRPSVGTSTIAGLPLALPAVEVHTVGCGGGSIARIDTGGALQVGPESAGAHPGPACYGIGDAPTVTDAHLALGHLGPETLLQGAFPVDPDRSVRAIEKLGKSLGLSTRKTAQGILEIAEVNMMRALLVITVQRAVDPARVPLVAFGGAGGLHAAALRKLLDMPMAIVPEHPGAFSAVGLALAGESAEHVQPVLQPLASLTKSKLDRLAQQATRLARKSGTTPKDAPVVITLGLRYEGQGPALAVPMRDPIERTMAREHDRLFGFVPEGRAIEVVELRARIAAPTQALPKSKSKGSPGVDASPFATRKPPVGGTPWPVYRRADVRTAQVLDGPCIVEEFTGATVIPSGGICTTTPAGIAITPAI